MMKIKLLTKIRGSDMSFEVGSVQDVPEETAIEWASRGVCTLIEEPKRSVNTKKETAVAKKPNYKKSK